jgi:hypothetical protein
LSKKTKKNVIRAGRDIQFCSSCGEALKHGSAICDVCGAIQGETVSRLDDSELENRLRSARAASLLFTFAVPVLVIVGLAAVFIPPVMVACLIAAAICLLFSLSYRSRMKRLVSANITRDALSEVFEDCRYTHGAHLPGSDVSAAGLIPDWDEIYGSDLVEGRYKGRRIRFSDIKLVDVKRRILTGKNGRDKYKRNTVFKGQWLVCELERELPAPVRVSEKTFGLFTGKGDVETESAVFNDKFRIQTSDSHLAFYILTPHFMEFILAADARADARIFLSFCGSQVHIALHNNRDSFELTGKKTDNIPALRSAMKMDVEYMLRIMDELFQNDYLFSYEKTKQGDEQ